MNSKEMRKVIWSFKDWELRAILDIVEEDDKKAKMIRRELALRKKERKNGKYEDRTVNPKTPLRERLEDGK